MGYFANATEAEYWKAENCAGCTFHNDGQCPVLLAHWLWGDEDCNNKTSRLHSMIPREGVHNGKCFAYNASVENDDPRRTEDYRARKWQEVFGKRANQKRGRIAKSHKVRSGKR